MTKEYIIREAAIAETRKPHLTDAELRRRLALIPAADVVEVRHGRWKSRQKWNYYVCSECSFENKIAFPYCPNCGARMDGGR